MKEGYYKVNVPGAEKPYMELRLTDPVNQIYTIWFFREIRGLKTTRMAFTASAWILEREIASKLELWRREYD